MGPCVYTYTHRHRDLALQPLLQPHTYTLILHALSASASHRDFRRVCLAVCLSVVLASCDVSCLLQPVTLKYLTYVTLLAAIVKFFTSSTPRERCAVSFRRRPSSISCVYTHTLVETMRVRRPCRSGFLILRVAVKSIHRPE